MMTKTQIRINTVLTRLSALVVEDADFTGFLAADLESMLSDIHNQDGFGTEGQTDPRGDFRDGKWSMDYVYGVDE